MKKLASLLIIAILTLGLGAFIAPIRAQPSGTGPVMYAEGPDSPLFPSTHTATYGIFPVTHPVWNISIMVANLSDTYQLGITVISMSIKSLDPTKVIVINAFQGADFASKGFTTFLNGTWDPSTGDLGTLTAAQTAGAMITSPIEIFKIEVEGKAFTGPAGVVVDIYDQQAYDTQANQVLMGDCPYDHTAYLLQVIQVVQPTAAFTWTPATIYMGDTVNFDATASNGGSDNGIYVNNIIAWQWDFGDGSPVANLTATPTYSYATAGTYTVTLTIFTDSSGTPDPSYQRTATVSHPLTVYPHATGIVFDLYTDYYRYPGYGPIPDYLIGLLPGGANGSLVESYSPQDLVCLYAKLTYNGEPISYKDIAFEISGPVNQYQNITIFRQAVTNGSGIAEICFRIPWADIPNHAEGITFGYWWVIAKADVANVEYSDWHYFMVHWMVQITSENGPYTVSELGTLPVSVMINNYALTPRNFTYAVTVYDALQVPVGSAYLQVVNAPPGISGPYTVNIFIPEWAYIGIGTVYKDIFTNLPWLCGFCWSPEQSEPVVITATSPHIPPF